ncbi:MAG: hypothetical protein J6A76_07960 [Oscillospiraceae bacterium]|nr:hypothetical protein [Oscillospiraceae bacterium]
MNESLQFWSFSHQKTKKYAPKKGRISKILKENRLLLQNAKITLQKMKENRSSAD